MKKQKVTRSKSRFAIIRRFINKKNLQKIPIIGKALHRRDLHKIMQKDLRSYRKVFDKEKNKKTSIPKSEKIELHCAWITEVYPPSSIEKLISSLEKLGWDKPEDSTEDNSNVVKWIQQNRSYGMHSSWMNGGVIRSHKDKTYSYGSNIKRSNLPQGVKYARLSIRNITYSLTIVTIQFVFDDTFATCLNELFKKSYSTKLIVRSMISTYDDVEKQKKRAIKDKLNDIHTSLYTWFKNNLPGEYTYLNEGIFPTVDLITSLLYEQPEDEKPYLRDSYINLLFDYGMELWKQKEDKNIELRIAHDSSSSPKAILFGNYDKLMNDTSKYGSSDRSALTYKLNESFDSTLGLWGVHYLLLIYEKQLSAIRDKATTRIRGNLDLEAYKSLSFIRSRFSSISTNIQNICDDMAVLIKNKNMYTADAMDFNPPKYLIDNYPSFVELIRQSDEVKIKQLLKLETRVNSVVSSRADLTSAMANLRVQWGVLLFTAVVTLFTIVSFFRDDSLLQNIQMKLIYVTNLVDLLLKKH
jgi:hypothetical protein